MAADQPGPLKGGFVANTDMSNQDNYLYRAAELVGDNAVDRCNAVTDEVIGIIYAVNESGLGVALATSGIVKWAAGAAITRGVRVRSDTTGRAVAAGAGEIACGVNLKTVAAANDIALVQLALHSRSVA